MTQPTTITSDARKIAEALRWYAEPREVSNGKIAASALPLAESLPGKIEALEKLNQELSSKNRGLVTALDNAHGTPCEQIRHMQELEDARRKFEAMQADIKLLLQERDDARHDANMWVEHLRERTCQLATMTQERDEWQSCAEEKIALLQHEIDTHRKRIEASNVFEAMWRSAEKETIDLEPQLDTMTKERDRLRDVIERDRTKTAELISTARGVLASRAWLAEGRGSYEFDDEKYQEEFSAVVTEILAALDPLRALAADWSDCPKDFQGARIDWKARAETAESQLAIITKERDEALDYALNLKKVADVRCKAMEEAIDECDMAKSQLAALEADRDHSNTLLDSCRLERNFLQRLCAKRAGKLEHIESQLAAVTKERDELQARYKCRTHERDHALSERNAAEYQLSKRDAEIGRLRKALRAIAECETPDVPDADFQRRARYDLQEIARATISIAAKQDEPTEHPENKSKFSQMTPQQQQHCCFMGFDPDDPDIPLD